MVLKISFNFELLSFKATFKALPSNANAKIIIDTISQGFKCS
jgi:hypothetical protein